MCVIVVFWILMSSNTPQNLETPILGSKKKKSWQVSPRIAVSFTDVSTTRTQCWRHHSETEPAGGKPAFKLCKEPKTQERQKSPRQCKEKSLNFKNCSKKLLLTSNKPWVTNYNFQCYRDKPFPPRHALLQWSRPPQESTRWSRSTVLHWCG